MRTLSCDVWDPVRGLGVEPGPPALGPLSLTTRPVFLINTSWVTSYTQLCTHSAGVPSAPSLPPLGHGRWESPAAALALRLLQGRRDPEPGLSAVTLSLWCSGRGRPRATQIRGLTLCTVCPQPAQGWSQDRKGGGASDVPRVWTSRFRGRCRSLRRLGLSCWVLLLALRRPHYHQWQCVSVRQRGIRNCKYIFYSFTLGIPLPSLLPYCGAKELWKFPMLLISP